MKTIIKLLTLVTFVLVVPTLLVWAGWGLCGLVPTELTDAILTLIPYAVAAVAWLGLAFLGGEIAFAAID